MFTEEEHKKILRFLKEKGASRPCHRCGAKEFAILGGPALYVLQEQIGGPINFGGPAVPVILVACTNCGAVIHHSMKVLGMLEEGKEAQNANG